MIKFDYSLVKNEGNEEVTYKPTVIPKELDNLVYIKAANSSGKSTLLNIIALGFYGLKNKNLDSSLQKKMNGLVNSTHQRLNAKISIGDRTGKTELVSTITNGKYEVRKFENNKEYVIQPDRFEREYNLIYDIPHNPTERLLELTREIETIQQNLGKDVHDFDKFLILTINAIEDSQDPNKITELKRNLKEKSDHQTPLNREITQYQEKIENLTRFLSIHFFKVYKDEREKIERKLSSVTQSANQHRQDRKKQRMHVSPPNVRQPDPPVSLSIQCIKKNNIHTL